MKKKGIGKRRALAACLAVMTAAQSTNALAAIETAGPSFEQGTWIQEGENWKYQAKDGTAKTGCLGR